MERNGQEEQTSGEKGRQSTSPKRRSTTIYRPDSKGRITLGRLAKGVSGFMASVGEEGDLHLVPLIEIPAREKWIFENPDILTAIQVGMKQSRDGHVVECDFSQFAAKDDEMGSTI